MSFFTKKEKYVMIFLALGALCGMSYSYYKEYNPPIRIDQKREQLKPRFSQKKHLDDLLKKEKTVNINTADFNDLLRLEGIGPVLANRIIEYRISNGSFKEKEDLKKVNGMGEKKFNEIKNNIEIE